MNNFTNTNQNQNFTPFSNNYGTSDSSRMNFYTTSSSFEVDETPPPPSFSRPNQSSINSFSQSGTFPDHSRMNFYTSSNSYESVESSQSKRTKRSGSPKRSTNSSSMINAYSNSNLPQSSGYPTASSFDSNFVIPKLKRGNDSSHRPTSSRVERDTFTDRKRMNSYTSSAPLKPLETLPSASRSGFERHRNTGGELRPSSSGRSAERPPRSRISKEQLSAVIKLQEECRTAYGVTQNLKNTPESHMSGKQKKKLKWALALLEKYKNDEVALKLVPLDAVKKLISKAKTQKKNDSDSSTVPQLPQKTPKIRHLIDQAIAHNWVNDTSQKKTTLFKQLCIEYLRDKGLIKTPQEEQEEKLLERALAPMTKFYKEQFEKTPEAERTNRQKTILNWADRFLEVFDVEKGVRRPPKDASENENKLARPLRLRKNSRRRALAAKEQIEKIPENKRSKLHKEMLEWANYILEMCNSQPNKLPKEPTTEQSGFYRVILDMGHPDGLISEENWKTLFNRMQFMALKVLQENPGPPPLCEDKGWFQKEVRLYHFADQRSADLCQKALDMLAEVWPGAKFQLAEKSLVPNKPRGIIEVPDGFTDPKEILEMIKLSNPQLPCEDWTVEKVDKEMEGFRNITLIVNDESLPLLEKNKNDIRFGFGVLQMKIHKTIGRSVAELKNPPTTTEEEKIIPKAENEQTEENGDQSTPCGSDVAEEKSCTPLKEEEEEEKEEEKEEEAKEEEEKEDDCSNRDDDDVILEIVNEPQGDPIEINGVDSPSTEGQN